MCPAMSVGLPKVFMSYIHIGELIVHVQVENIKCVTIYIKILKARCVRCAGYKRKMAWKVERLDMQMQLLRCDLWIKIYHFAFNI